jgi:hypothetical protein
MCRLFASGRRRTYTKKGHLRPIRMPHINLEPPPPSSETSLFQKFSLFLYDWRKKMDTPFLEGVEKGVNTLTLLKMWVTTKFSLIIAWKRIVTSNLPWNWLSINFQLFFWHNLKEKFKKRNLSLFALFFTYNNPTINHLLSLPSLFPLPIFLSIWFLWTFGNRERERVLEKEKR